MHIVTTPYFCFRRRISFSRLMLLAELFIDSCDLLFGVLIIRLDPQCPHVRFPSFCEVRFGESSVASVSFLLISIL